MKTIPFFLVLGLIFSCQEAKTTEKKQVAKNTASIPVRANAQIDLNVEGMVCQMGCGGSMRKELKNAGGVERVEVNFVEGEKTQLVQVSYDSLLISSNKIASILNTINDKQFTAKVVSKKSI
jgi:copper chaperone CopZ